MVLYKFKCGNKSEKCEAPVTTLITLNDKRGLISVLNLDKQKFQRGWETQKRKKSTK